MARSRRHLLRRLTLLSTALSALLALRERKLRENRERFNLP